MGRARVGLGGAKGWGWVGQGLGAGAGGRGKGSSVWLCLRRNWMLQRQGAIES